MKPVISLKEMCRNMKHDIFWILLNLLKQQCHADIRQQYTGFSPLATCLSEEMRYRVFNLGSIYNNSEEILPTGDTEPLDVCR